MDGERAKPFGDTQCVFKFDTQIANGTITFGVSKQKLNRA